MQGMYQLGYALTGRYTLRHDGENVSAELFRAAQSCSLRAEHTVVAYFSFLELLQAAQQR